MDEVQRVMWLAPTEYNAQEHGPSYLPSKVAGKKQASTGVPLVDLLGWLQAASLIHQTHHWNTKGPSFYADHLLFERLYNESQEFIDQVAERAIGMGQGIGALLLSQAVQVNVQAVLNQVPAGDFTNTSLVVESVVLAHIKRVIDTLESSSSMTPGVSNLLEGLYDKHETFVYLLKQRNVYSYDRS